MVRRGWLRRVPPSQERANEALKRAKRDLETARGNLALDWDWAYGIAYDAVLQSTFGLMATRGYRPGRGEGSHKIAVLFATAVLGESADPDPALFKKMRRDRNRLVYEIAGTITERQASKAIEYAERFVGRMERLIQAEREAR